MVSSQSTHTNSTDGDVAGHSWGKDDALLLWQRHVSLIVDDDSDSRNVREDGQVFILLDV